MTVVPREISGSSAAAAAPPRINPLARLPVFFLLEGLRAVVAGGTLGAVWKAELLSASGALVDVYAVEISAEMRAVAGTPPGGAIAIHERAWLPADLAGAAMAIGACSDDEDAARFAAAARAAGVPVNVVDNPTFCDFSFGSIVNRSPLVIAISTDGAAPVFAQAIRAKIETLIPRGFAGWAAAARGWRSALKSSGLSFNARRHFWQLFTASALNNPDHIPEQPDYDRLLDRAFDEAASADRGSVTLVCAGPGDPELLTLRAVRALQSSDVILHDGQVSQGVLDFARREARKMLIPAGAGIEGMLVGLAQSGRRAAWLMGSNVASGDIEATITACRKAHIAVEWVPGLTADAMSPQPGMPADKRRAKPAPDQASVGAAV
jgi:uroporphyrin-III C-methyltransferase/precorrin-2 dehydrogenase/sirohydrochlorin ferrochelatase